MAQDNPTTSKRPRPEDGEDVASPPRGRSKSGRTSKAPSNRNKDFDFYYAKVNGSIERITCFHVRSNEDETMNSNHDEKLLNAEQNLNFSKFCVRSTVIAGC